MKKGQRVDTIFGKGSFVKDDNYGQKLIKLDKCPDNLKELHEQYGGLYFYKIDNKGLWS